MVVCRPPECVYRLTCLDRMRTLGAVKPRREDTALNIQGSNFPITRPGGDLKRTSAGRIRKSEPVGILWVRFAFLELFWRGGDFDGG